MAEEDPRPNSATATGADTSTDTGTDTDDAEERERTFEKSIVVGHERLTRTLPVMIATGVVGGFDVGLGVAAQFVVLEATGSPMLGALAFSIGFIALTLAGSELFTEDFLVPVTTVVTDADLGASRLVRLWSVTLVSNLAGGFVFMVLGLAALPQIAPLLATEGRHFIDAGIGTEAFASAILGGFAITLMTWMERGSDNIVGKLVAAIAVGFLLAAGPLNHSVVRSLEMFGALIHGADFGYADWTGALGVAIAGNIVGGLGLVTVIRLVQIGSRKIEAEQNRSARTDDPGAATSRWGRSP